MCNRIPVAECVSDRRYAHASDWKERGIIRKQKHLFYVVRHLCQATFLFFTTPLSFDILAWVERGIGNMDIGLFGNVCRYVIFLY